LQEDIVLVNCSYSFVFTCIIALLNRSVVLVLWIRSWSCELWSWS